MLGIVGYMTNATNTKTPAAIDEMATSDLLDRSEVTRTLNIVKHSVSELYNDARRKTPYFASSKKEAQAKLSAALKALEGFADSLDSIKKS